MSSPQEKPENGTPESEPELKSPGPDTKPEVNLTSSSSPESKVLAIGVLGRVRPLSEPEQITYYGCEAVVANGWNNFLQVGLALAQIRGQ
jgi:hypothetical protein